MSDSKDLALSPEEALARMPKSLRPAFPLVPLLIDPIRNQVFRVDAKRAMKLAERMTGLSDYGEHELGFRQRLDDTIADVVKTDWNTLGLFGIRYVLHWHIGNRLRLVELKKQRPDIADIEIERPLVITGLFRTGTTFMHNVLAADPANRAARMWELCRPVGRKHDLMGDEKWRRWRTSHEVLLDNVIIPEQNEAHTIGVEAFEEDFFLLENDMMHMKIIVGMGDFDYGNALLDWDFLPAYKLHKFQLQALWAQRAADRWLLKAPWHLWNLKAMLAVYPDARIIHTHRGLVPTIGSQCSLSARIAGKFRRTFDLYEIGRFWLQYSKAGVDRGLEVRESLPPSQVYDVRLSDVRRSPLEVVQDIYQQFDLPFNDQLAEAFAARIAEEPTTQQGEHEYDIADYGLSEDQIQNVFADYRQRFGV